MKHWALGIAFAGAVALAPLPAAADGSRHYGDGYKDVYREPLPSWGGFYVGGFAGFVHSWADIDVTDYYYTVSYSADSTDAFLGGLIGYNIQHGSRVYGIEGALGVVTGGSGAEFEVRGRFGFLSDNWLYYGTAGVAFGGEPDFDLGHVDDTAFVIGAGAETKIGHNTTLGLEGLYYYYGEDSYSTPFADVDVSGGAFALRGRLTFKLNGQR